MALPIKKLERGQGLRIRKEDGTPLHMIEIGLGWRSKLYDTQAKFDVDVTVAVLKETDGKPYPQLLSEDWFIYYYQPRSPFGAVIHSGDDTDGGDGKVDNETVKIDLSKLPPEADTLAIVLTIDEATSRKQTFGQIKSYARLSDLQTGQELGRIDLENEEKTANATAVLYAEIKKVNGDWIYKNVTEGFVQGLGDFLTLFGGQVDDSAPKRV
jgi:tellurium resistance protein TerD